MRASEIREMSDEALVHREFSLERELLAMRFRHSMQELENTSQMRVLRKDIARIQTEARSRETQQGLPKNSLRDQYRSSFSAAGGESVEVDDAVQEAPSGGFLSGIVDKLTGKE
jgi:large subunit ribosomal protein L29